MERYPEGSRLSIPRNQEFRGQAPSLCHSAKARPALAVSDVSALTLSLSKLSFVTVFVTVFVTARGSLVTHEATMVGRRRFWDECDASKTSPAVAPEPRDAADFQDGSIEAP